MSLNPQKALETIGNNLQRQYERWQPRARLVEYLSVTTTSRTSVPVLELHVLAKWYHRNRLFSCDKKAVPSHTSFSLPFKTLSQKSVHSRIFSSFLLLSGHELSSQFFLEAARYLLFISFVNFGKCSGGHNQSIYFKSGDFLGKSKGLVGIWKLMTCLRNERSVEIKISNLHKKINALQ